MSSSVGQLFDSSLCLGSNNNKSTDMKTICPELGSMITKICHKYSDVSLDSIEYLFNKEFLYELKLKEHGFVTFEELFDYLIRDNYPIELYNNLEDIQCFQTNRDYFYWLSVIKCNKSYHLIDILSDIPEDVISSGQQLPELQLSEAIPLNGCPEILSGDILSELNYCEVRLMTAQSPHEIYLNICGEDYHNSYHKLMIEMRYYDNKELENNYRISSLLLFEGLICAVKYPKMCNEWHRSRLLSIDKHNNCRLFLVDIGDVIETNANNLRLLLKKFAELPAQAIKAQLIGIRPKVAKGLANKWSDWAKNLVVSLEDHKYSGKIECAFIDHQLDRYRVYLSFYHRFKSANVNDLISLNQLLIDKHLAVITSNDKPVQ